MGASRRACRRGVGEDGSAQVQRNQHWKQRVVGSGRRSERIREPATMAPPEDHPQAPGRSSTRYQLWEAAARWRPGGVCSLFSRPCSESTEGSGSAHHSRMPPSRPRGCHDQPAIMKSRQHTQHRRDGGQHGIRSLVPILLRMDRRLPPAPIPSASRRRDRERHDQPAASTSRYQTHSTSAPQSLTAVAIARDASQHHAVLLSHQVLTDQRPPSDRPVLAAQATRWNPTPAGDRSRCSAVLLPEPGVQSLLPPYRTIAEHLTEGPCDG